MSAAAMRMNCTPPGISQHMSGLEKRLGVELLTRSSRGVMPTPVGKKFYDKCLHILRTVSDAEHEIETLRDGVAGSVSVGIIPALSKAILPASLRRYTADYPAVDVYISESYAGTLTQSLLSGELDFAVVPTPANTAGLHVEKFSEQPNGLISNKMFGLEHMKPVRMDGIPNLKLIMPSYQHPIRSVIESAIQIGDIKVQKQLSIDGLIGTLEFVAQSDWSAIVPAALCHNLKTDTRFVINPIEHPDLRFGLALLQLERQTLSHPARLLVDIFRQEFDNVDQGW